MEGHRGLDGRFYLLDLARAFPPECPFEVQAHLELAPPHAVFFRMLRPEFLQLLKNQVAYRCAVLCCVVLYLDVSLVKASCMIYSCIAFCMALQQ